VSLRLRILLAVFMLAVLGTTSWVIVSIYRADLSVMHIRAANFMIGWWIWSIYLIVLGYGFGSASRPTGH
jgi:hypothetical protein